MTPFYGRGNLRRALRQNAKSFAEPSGRIVWQISAGEPLDGRLETITVLGNSFDPEARVLTQCFA
jgi:hypothetical protein